MRALFHRSHVAMVLVAAALGTAALVPAAAADKPLVWDPPIETEIGVPGGIVHGAAGYVSVDPHPLEDIDGPLETSMFFSADGFDWDEVTIITTARLSGVAAGGPGFVAVGRKRISGDLLGPAVWVSADGQSWSEVAGVTAATTDTGPGLVLHTVDPIPFRGGWMTDVASDGAMLVAVGHTTAGESAVWTSSDGLAWTLVPGSPLGRPEATPDRIAAGAAGWMVVTRELIDADSPGPMFTWWSTDGTTWQPADDDESFGATIGFGPFVDGLLGFGDGFVMVGQLDRGPVAWVSADGRSWSAPYTLPTRPETGSSFVSDAATDGELLVVVGDDVVFDPGFGPATSEASIWISSTGTDWVQVAPESLRGDVTLHGVDAGAVNHVAGWWVVHGSTSDPGEDGINIAWVGRPIDAGAFADVPPGHLFYDDIQWFASSGITKGCNPPFNTLFCPSDVVTRDQTAAFFVRAFGFTDDGGGNLFVDDDGSIFETDIDKLGTAGITKGCNPPINDKYCPSGVVTRAQAAAFFVRAFGFTDDGGGNLFVDDDGSIFETDIDKLGTAGITKGCNPPINDRYCPHETMTRAQLAAFLNRALG